MYLEDGWMLGCEIKGIFARQVQTPCLNPVGFSIKDSYQGGRLCEVCVLWVCWWESRRYLFRVSCVHSFQHHQPRPLTKTFFRSFKTTARLVIGPEKSPRCRSSRIRMRGRGRR